jgi:hypothetical protein
MCAHVTAVRCVQNSYQIPATCLLVGRSVCRSVVVFSANNLHVQTNEHYLWKCNI